mmetsp:Transcript_6519/g.8535  ORF Transcript_6519/g.8535 Transcript_6519/m.8535 type:complete len:362 (+) Transcript_6519:110-1195(+)
MALHINFGEHVVTVGYPGALPLVKMAAVVAKIDRDNTYVFGDAAVELNRSDSSVTLMCTLDFIGLRGVKKEFETYLLQLGVVKDVVDGGVLVISTHPVIDNGQDRIHDFVSYPYIDLRFNSLGRYYKCFDMQKELLCCVKSGSEYDFYESVIGVSMYSDVMCVGETHPNKLQSWDRIELGLDTIFNYFLKLLSEKGYDFTSPQGQQICRDQLFKYCYVATNYEQEMLKLERSNGVFHRVKLDDETYVELGQECFLAPEIIFTPSLVGIDDKGLVDKALGQINSISARKMRRRNVNIVLQGDLNERFFDLSERLQAELSQKFRSLTISTANIDTIVNTLGLPTIKYYMYLCNQITGRTNLLY